MDASASSAGADRKTGAGSKNTALAMTHKLLDAVHDRWRVFNGA